MPIKNWKLAMNRFMIEFEEQLAPLPLWLVTQNYLQALSYFYQGFSWRNPIAFTDINGFNNAGNISQ
jgi:hypothetical protein